MMRSVITIILTALFYLPYLPGSILCAEGLQIKPIDKFTLKKGNSAELTINGVPLIVKCGDFKRTPEEGGVPFSVLFGSNNYTFRLVPCNI